MASSTRDSSGTGHPVTAAVAVARAALAEAVEQPLWSLDAVATRHLLLDLTALVSQVAELESRAVVHADAVGVHEESGATSVATWLAHATRMTHREAHAKVRQAKLLAAHDEIRAAVARGEVLVDQARVIGDAVDALPDRPDLHERAKKHLLGEARHFNAVDLRRLGKRVLDVVDPGAGEAAEAAALAREERRAATATRLTMSDDGHGKTFGRFTIPTVQAAMLRKMLLAIAAPKHQRASGTEPFVPGRPSVERMGRAFCELIERYPADRLPKVGGLNCTVVVTMTLESLLGGLAAATVDTGERITATQARRLACEAGVVPAVLGSTGRVLDLGRTTRFATESLRLALAVEQRSCQHPTCSVPGWMCHVHHPTPWSKGGRTDRRNAQLLCPRHHALAHRDPPTPPLRT